MATFPWGRGKTAGPHITQDEGQKAGPQISEFTQFSKGSSGFPMAFPCDRFIPGSNGTLCATLCDSPPLTDGVLLSLEEEKSLVGHWQQRAWSAPPSTTRQQLAARLLLVTRASDAVAAAALPADVRIIHRAAAEEQGCH